MRYLLSSTGLYATWIYARAFNTLFDCGEGAASVLRSKIFGVDRICLSHGHMDHIGGLPGFVCARTTARGAANKPLQILYPEGDASILAMKAYIDTLSADFDYAITWTAIGEDFSLDLPGGHHTLAAFRSQHIKGLTLGYQIYQMRRRLKPAYRDDPGIGRKLAGLTATQRATYQESVPLRLVAYSGDTMPIDPAVVEGAQVLFFDATFLHQADRRYPSHASLEEAYELARAAGVGACYAIHVSPRYTLEEVAQQEAAYRRRQPGFAFHIVRPGSVLEI